MAFPSYTYTFTNGSTADATQVNQDFSDILNGVTDGTKDISVNNATCAGTATLNGNVVLGNSSAKTITINGVISSSIALGTHNTYDIGTDTVGLRALYLGSSGSAHSTKLVSDSIAAAVVLTLPKSTGNLALQTMTVQAFTTGSGTYTTPTGCRMIRVLMVGGGGGGGGSSTFSANNGGTGGTGGNSTFGTTLLVANGGVGGPNFGNAGGLGGSGSLGTGPIGFVVAGGMGGMGSGFQSSGEFCVGGQGASSVFGGGGGAGDVAAAIGNPGTSNTGGGGGGAATGAINGRGGSGGGAGGFVSAIITSPNATYAYAVGAGGAQGASGTSGFHGGLGGSGYIVVEEYY